jgi:hypothetical protein
MKKLLILVLVPFSIFCKAQMVDIYPEGSGSGTGLTPAQELQLDSIQLKVDKVSGKALSTNDFTNANKSSLDSMHLKVDKEAGSRLITTAEINQIHRSQVDSIRANITNTLTITFAHQITVYLKDTISGNLTISSSFDALSKLGDIVIINLIGSGGGRSITSYAGAYKVEGSADYDDTAGRRQQIIITRESNGLLSRYVKFW